MHWFLIRIFLLIFQNCVDGFTQPLIIECSPGWEDTIQFRSWGAINTVLGYFRRNIVAAPDYLKTSWYTMALTEEYATIARERISNFHQFGYKNDEFQLPEWSTLSHCEQTTIKYQSVINHLGKNLQCVSSAALIASETFFINVMPIIDSQTSEKMQLYIDKYNKEKSKDVVLDIIDQQTEWAERMLNSPSPQISYSGKGAETMHRRRSTKEPYVSAYSREAYNTFTGVFESEATAIVKEYLEGKHEVCT